MSTLLLHHIHSLAGIIPDPSVRIKSGKEMQEFSQLEDSWLTAKDGIISGYGTMDTCPPTEAFDVVHDLTGRYVLPAYVDSHTHLVYARSREEEFVMRIRGKSYEEIAAAGGGILNSAARLRNMSEDELFAAAKIRLESVIRTGTGAIEIKSGYGLTTSDEIKMLRVIRRLKAISPIPVKATFLGAHAIPLEHKSDRRGYIREIIDVMLPQIAAEDLAVYCDVFCDNGFYTPEETDEILQAAARYALKPKIHGNELGFTGGVQAAVRNHAISVDHLEYTGPEEIAELLRSSTIPVGLPNCSFFLGIPYAPGRAIIDAGLPFCIASDYNPGSSPNGRMSLVVALACINMKITPEEALNASTINGAAALELSHETGSITIGKRANLIITKPIPSLAYIPYHFGDDPVDQVIINGELFKGL